MMDDPDVDVVYIAAPNMVHVELVEAAAQAGKHVFCEKPVGGTPEQTVRAEKAARDVISGVGYNYRWAPLVRYAKQLIESGELGELTNYRGRFFSMYGSDPLGLLSWRFKLDEGGYGVTSDLLSHSVDLAHMLLGPITRVVGTTATFITERPLALPGAGHYGRGAPGDPTGEVTNEDYAGMLCEFANGVRGTFESSRTIVGPESQMAFDVHGTQGRRRLEPREAQRAAAVPAHRRPGLAATRPSSAATASPTTGTSSRAARTASASRTWSSIEDYEFCRAIAEERPFSPGFNEAVEWVSVQAALLKSVQTGRWETGRLAEGGLNGRDHDQDGPASA